MKKTRLKIFLSILFILLMVGIIEILFKKHSNKSQTIDYINRFNLPLYADTTLYSGYMGNFGLINDKTLDKERIDSLLKTQIPVYYKLTKEDRKEFIFSIDQNAIKKAHDTIIIKDKIQVINIPLKFTNYSNDTLKYLSMDCTWLDYFFTDNRKIEFAKQICFHNVPCIDTLPPHHTINIYIPIVVNGKIKSTDRKFRIGMSLQKFIDNSQPYNIAFDYMLRPETSNLIWSNQIQLP